MQFFSPAYLRMVAGLTIFSSASLAFADISGTVFRDFNADGLFTQNSLLTESGMPGINVAAFDADDPVATPSATVVSGADGTYVLSGLVAGGQYRIEFSWSESWISSGVSGSNSVQFAADGADSINLALSVAEDYRHDKPQVATSHFVVGEPTTTNVTGKPAVIEFAYDSGAAGRDFDVSASGVLEEEVSDIAVSAAPGVTGTLNAQPVSAGASKIINMTVDQIGPVYGLSYHRQSNSLLAAAFTKRFAGFPGGSSDSLLGSIHLINRNTNPNSLSLFYSADAGVDSHDYSRDDLGSPRGDNAAAGQVSKSGWGDIDLNSDGSVLYAINLFDKNIHVIPVVSTATGISAGSATTVAFPATITSGLCANDDWVPGGVKVRRGSVFVTVTCTAEASQLASDLKHYVYQFAEGSPAAFTQVAVLNNYTRQNGFFDNQWHPWLSTAIMLNGTSGDTTDPGRYAYPQPWLMDIEFDDFGKIYLGMRNRTSDMRAAFNDAGQPAYEYGDTLVGMPDGSGGYTMLMNGQASVYEFIDDNTTTGSEHPDNDMGSLAVLPGSGEIMVPATIGNVIQGIRTYDAVDATTTAAKSGVPLRYYGLTQASANVAAGNSFGKNAGLGDIEIMAAAAPVEVGNRIWEDTDRDGIQDADEPGIDGVVVSLSCGTDSAVTTSADGGHYYFSNAPAGNAPFMDYAENCTLSINSDQVTIKGYKLTVVDAEGDDSNSGLTDIRDSDATDNAGVAEIDFVTGNMGENNHALDFGYRTALVDLQLEKTTDKTTYSRGEAVIYTLTITNAGPDDASGIKVEDNLPDSVTYVSHSPAGESFSGAVWDVGALEAGAVKVLEITATIN